MDPYLWTGMVGAIAGVMGWEFAGYITERIKRPYRWKCPRCDFKISTNFEGGYTMVRESHIQDHKERDEVSS